MVSIAASGSEISEQLTAGLNAEDSARVLEALAFIKPIYETKTVVTGQDAFLFAQGVATTLAHL